MISRRARLSFQDFQRDLALQLLARIARCLRAAPTNDARFFPCKDEPHVQRCERIPGIRAALATKAGGGLGSVQLGVLISGYFIPPYSPPTSPSYPSLLVLSTAPLPPRPVPTQAEPANLSRPCVLRPLTPPVPPTPPSPPTTRLFLSL